MKGMTHRQVRVRARGRDAYVDAGLTSLIRALWLLDVDTVSSCQGGPEDPLNPLAVIAFPAYAGSAFLAIIEATITGDPEADMLGRRIRRISTAHDRMTDPYYIVGNWAPDDRTIPPAAMYRLPAATCRCCWTWTADGVGGELITWLYFPPADIPVIGQRLRQLPGFPG